VVEGGGRRGDGDSFFHAVRRAARHAGVGSLLVARGGAVVVLSHADQDWEAVRHAVIDQLGGGSCRMGIGCSCTSPAEFPTSHRQANLALRVQGRGSMMVDLLRTHPRILLGGMLIENPCCLTPDEFLATRTKTDELGA
jgi:hypothetical protein